MAVPLTGRPATRHLVIFARAPRVGAVKRRLAGGIGAVPAWVFYRRTLAATLRLAADRRWKTWVAVTPDGYGRKGRWWPPGIGRLPQGRGDLGRRMDRALRAPRRGAVVLIGADIPGIRAGHVAEAFRMLGSRDFVFGPALDGGYWLVGARRRAAFPYVFGGVRWSTGHALADTLRNVREPRSTGFAPTMRDVDRAEDLPDVVRRRAASRAPGDAA